MNRLDTAAIKHTVKAPRSHLDRCVFVLKLSADLRKQDTSGNSAAINDFVDQAYEYLKQVATTAKEPNKSPVPSVTPPLDWDQMKDSIKTISSLVPGLNIMEKLEKAEAKDITTSNSLASVARKIKAKCFNTKEVELLIVGERWEVTRLQTINVLEKTQPSALAAALAFAPGGPPIGSGFDFYRPRGVDISRQPAEWNDDEPIPHRLFVVPSRGHFTFLSIPLFSSDDGRILIRNVFKLLGIETIYLKHSSGLLLEKPKREVIQGQPVLCSISNSPGDQLEVRTWDEVVEKLRTQLDLDWEIKPMVMDKKDDSVLGENAADSRRVTSSMGVIKSRATTTSDDTKIIKDASISTNASINNGANTMDEGITRNEGSTSSKPRNENNSTASNAQQVVEKETTSNRVISHQTSPTPPELPGPPPPNVAPKQVVPPIQALGQPAPSGGKTSKPTKQNWLKRLFGL
ncbi:hypothetical protein FRC17_006663 [Serendipita sp. 399]|nr:hypothetical protein FRC17_006663 [Serendipita sp. 399]